MNKFLGRYGRCGAIPYGVSDLLGQLLPDVTNGKKTGDRGLHILIRKDVAFFVSFQWGLSQGLLFG